jgi:hypothetical protein
VLNSPLFRCTCEGCPRNDDELSPHPHNPVYRCWPCWSADRDNRPHLHVYRNIAKSVVNSIGDVETSYENWSAKS